MLTAIFNPKQLKTIVMKRHLCMLSLVLVVQLSYAVDSDGEKDLIVIQETAWAQALVAGNMNAVDTLMHSDFRLIRTYSDAPPIDKAAYLGMTGMSTTSVEVTSVRAEVVDNVATAQATWSLDWQREGVGKLPPHYKVTDIWIKETDGIWRIISRVSQLADAPPAV